MSDPAHVMRGQGHEASSQRWHLEQLAFLRPLHPAAANALHAHTLLADGAVDGDLNALQIRRERPPADACDLAADATQILGLTAARILIAEDRFFSTDGALPAHS